MPKPLHYSRLLLQATASRKPNLPVRLYRDSHADLHSCHRRTILLFNDEQCDKHGQNRFRIEIRRHNVHAVDDSKENGKMKVLITWFQVEITHSLLYFGQRQEPSQRFPGRCNVLKIKLIETSF